MVEYTNLGKDDGSYLTTDQIYVKNSTQGQEVDVAALASQPVDLKLGAGPQILIVHTHGSEAYTQDEQDVYVESDPYRTTDCTKNVVRVGEEMAQVFRSQGLDVYKRQLPLPRRSHGDGPHCRRPGGPQHQSGGAPDLPPAWSDGHLSPDLRPALQFDRIKYAVPASIGGGHSFSAEQKDRPVINLPVWA